MRGSSVMLILLLVVIILIVLAIFFMVFFYKKAIGNFIKYSTYPVVQASGLTLHYYSLVWNLNQLQCDPIPIDLVGLPQMNFFRQKETTHFFFGTGIPAYPYKPSLGQPLTFNAFTTEWYFSLVPLDGNITFLWELSNGTVTYSLTVSAQNQLTPIALDRTNDAAIKLGVAKVSSPKSPQDWYNSTDLNINIYSTSPFPSSTSSFPSSTSSNLVSF